jgi:hypothetical protein
MAAGTTPVWRHMGRVNSCLNIVIVPHDSVRCLQLDKRTTPVCCGARGAAALYPATAAAAGSARY